VYQAASSVGEALDAYDAERAAWALAGLAADLVQWYLPHRPEGGREAVEVLGCMLAPFAPHLAEAIHRQLGGQKVQSVHLGAWPSVDPSWEDGALLAQMAKVGRVVALAKDARGRAGLQAAQKVRQALVMVGAGDGDGAESLEPFSPLLADAMAVGQVRFTAEAAVLVGWRLRLDPERMAARNVKQAELEAALSSLTQNEIAALISQLGEGLSARFTVAGHVLTLLPDEVQITPEAQPGWTAAADVDAGLLVVLATD
jgi:leucyl-tRNA synthetase